MQYARVHFMKATAQIDGPSISLSLSLSFSRHDFNRKLLLKGIFQLYICTRATYFFTGKFKEKRLKTTSNDEFYDLTDLKFASSGLLFIGIITHYF